ncbi:hypothetical protein [Streptomyces sp. NPDC001070]
MATSAAAPKSILDNPLTHFGRRVVDRTAPGTPEAECRLRGVSPLTPHIGAEIAGFSSDRHDFRPEHHLALAGVWGELEANPFFPKAEIAGVSLPAQDAMAVGNGTSTASRLPYREPGRGACAPPCVVHAHLPYGGLL